MKAQKLAKGSTIGIVCPSHIASAQRHAHSIHTLEALGFRVKLGANVYKDTYGYLASEWERADDFNAMVCDESVDMVLFGGGEGANELLPLLDYEAIALRPKLYCSFSDGTTILNAIYAMAGLSVYYGQGPGMFCDLRHYDYTQFFSHFVEGNAETFVKNSPWRTLHGGACEGTLIGGYTANFALLLGSRYFRHDKTKKYILFLEDHEKFSSVAHVSSLLSHIEQHAFMDCVGGLLFGHYAENTPEDLFKRLARLGQKHGIPVVCCDDFGHGDNHAIFPIGEQALFDGDRQMLAFR